MGWKRGSCVRRYPVIDRSQHFTKFREVQFGFGEHISVYDPTPKKYLSVRISTNPKFETSSVEQERFLVALTKETLRGDIARIVRARFGAPKRILDGFLR